MGSARHRSAPRALALAGSLALLGCASPQPLGHAALFKAPMGDISGGVGPGPHAYWYVQRQPVEYVNTGLAVWRLDHPHGLQAWISHLFGHGRWRGETSAIAAKGLALPVPCQVQVTNVANGQALTVRVDDKARLGDAMIRLSADAAKGLGADPGKPLTVRIRYLAPVLAYEERPPLRYAFRAPPRRPHPAAPAPEPVVLAAQTRPAPPPPAPAPVAGAPAHAEPAPAVIRVAETHPSAPALRGSEPLPGARPKAPTRPVCLARVQVGAFASLANARRAAGRLQPAGEASIEPVRHDGATLYRVIVSAHGDATRLRTRTVQIGFTDARIVRPL